MTNLIIATFAFRDKSPDRSPVVVAYAGPCQGREGGSEGGFGGVGAGREEMKFATSRGRSQRSVGHRSVGWEEQLKMCDTVWSAVPHSGQSGEGILQIRKR